jgi:hypothetical protein
MDFRSDHERLVNVLLRGGRVTATFREALFDAANREGISANEFVLQAAAEKLLASGRHFSGLFNPGDLDSLRGV